MSRAEDTFCVYHRANEPAGRNAIRCPECRHAFRNPAELVTAFNRDVVDALNRRREPGTRLRDWVHRVSMVPFCPLCAHDLPDLSHLERR